MRAKSCKGAIDCIQTKVPIDGTQSLAIVDSRRLRRSQDQALTIQTSQFPGFSVTSGGSMSRKSSRVEQAIIFSRNAGSIRFKSSSSPIICPNWKLPVGSGTGFGGFAGSGYDLEIRFRWIRMMRMIWRFSISFAGFENEVCETFLLDI